MLINSTAFGAKTQFWRTTVHVELNIYYLLHINCPSSLTNGKHSKTACGAIFLPSGSFFVLLWLLGKKDGPGITFRGRPDVCLTVQNRNSGQHSTPTTCGPLDLKPCLFSRWEEDAAATFSQLLAPGSSLPWSILFPFSFYACIWDFAKICLSSLNKILKCIMLTKTQKQTNKQKPHNT